MDNPDWRIRMHTLHKNSRPPEFPCETAALASEVEKFPKPPSSLVYTSAVWWVGYITCLRHT